MFRLELYRINECIYLVNKTNENIALFPLNVFLLPGDYTQLYIFEERYKQLISDCTNSGKQFGIAFTHKRNQQNLGSLVEVAEILKVYPSGEMDILIRATSLFRLDKFNFQKEGKLYPGGDVHYLENIKNTPASAELQVAFKEFLLKGAEINTELLARNDLGLFDIANELGMTDDDKLEFAEIVNSEERDQYLIQYLRYLQLLELQQNSVYHNIFLN